MGPAVWFRDTSLGAGVLMKIRRPETLIIQRYTDFKGGYCSVGWLAKECGIDVDTAIANGAMDSELFGCIGEFTGVDSKTLSALMLANDRMCYNQERIEYFVSWCAKHGIEVSP